MRKTTLLIFSLLVICLALIGLSPALFAESIVVMSYNIHRGGIIHKKQPLSQTAKGIQLAKADIVGVQETRSPRGDTLKDLAELLGWNHDEGSGIVTRYEIVENFKGGKDYKGGIKVKLASDKHAYIFNLHLPSHPYQPYQLLGIRPKWHKHINNITFIKTEAETIEWAKKARGKEVAKLLKTIKNLPDKEVPVFVVGDFNEPSHLDWTEATAKAGRHPLKVAYPTSKAFGAAGFGDAYRTIYPDEMKNPGMTWSSKYKDDDPTSHPDRIDFVYFKGKGLQVNEVKVVGEDKEKADIVVTLTPLTTVQWWRHSR